MSEVVAVVDAANAAAFSCNEMEHLRGKLKCVNRQ